MVSIFPLSNKQNKKLPFPNPSKFQFQPQTKRGKEHNMDSLKMFKGYGKVEHEQHHLEDHCNPKPKPKFSKPFIATISIFAILFLTLTFAFALASILHHTKSQQQLLINLVESIRFVCNVTRFPSACLPAIPPSANIANRKRSSPSHFVHRSKRSRASIPCSKQRIHVRSPTVGFI